MCDVHWCICVTFMVVGVLCSWVQVYYVYGCRCVMFMGVGVICFSIKMYSINGCMCVIFIYNDQLNISGLGQ